MFSLEMKERPKLAWGGSSRQNGLTNTPLVTRKEHPVEHYAIYVVVTYGINRYYMKYYYFNHVYCLAVVKTVK